MHLVPQLFVCDVHTQLAKFVDHLVLGEIAGGEVFHLQQNDFSRHQNDCVCVWRVLSVADHEGVFRAILARVRAVDQLLPLSSRFGVGPKLGIVRDLVRNAPNAPHSREVLFRIRVREQQRSKQAAWFGLGDRMCVMRLVLKASCDGLGVRKRFLAISSLRK